MFDRKLIPSTLKFLNNNCIFVASNWTEYVDTMIKDDILLIKKCHDMMVINIPLPTPSVVTTTTTAAVVDVAASYNKISKSFLESLYDAELRVNYFLYGEFKRSLQTKRMKWLFFKPNVKVHENLDNHAIVFWKQPPNLSVKQRMILKQPMSDFYKIFYGLPFLHDAISILFNTAYPDENDDDDDDNNAVEEEEEDGNTAVAAAAGPTDKRSKQQKLEDVVNKAVDLLIIKLACMARFSQGIPSDARYRLKNAFKKKTIHRIVMRAGDSSKIKINGAVPVFALINKILKPDKLIGQLIRSTTLHLDEDDTTELARFWRTALEKYIKNNIQVFPMALLSNKHQRYCWYNIRNPTVQDRHFNTTDPQTKKLLSLRPFAPVVSIYSIFLTM